MKVGDTFVVMIDGIGVAEALVEEIDDGKATIIIPATRIVMGIKSNLVPAVPEVERTNTALVEDPNADAKSDLEADYDSAFDKPQNEFVDIPEPTTSLRDMNFDSSAID